MGIYLAVSQENSHFQCGNELRSGFDKKKVVIL